MEVVHQHPLPEFSAERHDQAVVQAGSVAHLNMPILKSDDPMDFFGAICDLVEHGLTPEEKASFHHMQKGGVTVRFPLVSERPDFEDDAKQEADVMEKVASLNREIEDLKEQLKAARMQEDTLLKDKRDSEREHAEAKAVLEMEKAEIGVLRSQIGTPTATQLENQQFTLIFNGGTKVDLASKLLTTSSYKKDLEFSVGKLVKYRENLKVLETANIGLKQEGDRVKEERDQLKKVVDSLAGMKAKVEADVEDAKKMVTAIVKREREGLLRVKEKLYFERANFRRYKERSEGQMRRLKEEAEKADDLEERLKKNVLRLKQKEAEARALSVDENVVRELRQNVSANNDAPKALCLDMASVLISKTVAEDEAKLRVRLEQQLQELQASMIDPMRTTSKIPQPTNDSHSNDVARALFVYDGIAQISDAATAVPAATVAEETVAQESTLHEPVLESARTQSMSSVGDDDTPMLKTLAKEEFDEVVRGHIPEETEGQETQVVGEDIVNELEIGDSGEESVSCDGVSGEEGEENGVVVEGKLEQDDDSSSIGNGAIEEEEGNEYVSEDMDEVEELSSEQEENVSDAETEECESEVDKEVMCPIVSTEDTGNTPAARYTSPVENKNDAETVSPPQVGDVTTCEATELASTAQEDGTGSTSASEAPSAEGRNKPRLSLEKGKYAETDQEAAAFAAALFAAKQALAHNVKDTAAAVSVERGFLDSRGTTRSYSVSPRLNLSAVGGVDNAGNLPPQAPVARSVRRSYMRAPSITMDGLSPTARLMPAEHGIETNGSIVVIELGTWKVRAGLVAKAAEGQRWQGLKGSKSKSFFDEFPCCVARPKTEGADLNELVNGASSMASPMYDKFRETGVFVGGDAWYCCMDHPDSVLRSKLTLSSPLNRGRVVPRDGSTTSDDMERLLDHSFALLKQDPTDTPTLVTYKPTATAQEVHELASILLEQQGVPAVRCVNEASLTAIAANMTTGIVVDIGESGVYVTPIYEKCAVTVAMKWQPCGGADMTSYLDHMLVSRTNERFNQMVDRRRLEYARTVKEVHCAVPLNFSEEANRCGKFRRKTMRVFEGANLSPKLSNYDACSSQEFNEDKNMDDPVTVSFTQKAGTQFDIKVGRERFHTPELLFQPDLWSEVQATDGLDDLVLQSLHGFDGDMKADMLRDVVLVGGSAAFPGLVERLQQDLVDTLPTYLSDAVHVRVIDAAILRHSNNISRGNATAVTVGAEILLRTEDTGSTPWVQSSDWDEYSESGAFPGASLM